MLLFAFGIGGLAILVCVLAEDPDSPAPRPIPGSVHRAVPNPADVLDEPYARLRAEDDYQDQMLGEPRRYEGRPVQDPFCGLVEYLDGPVER